MKSHRTDSLAARAWGLVALCCTLGVLACTGADGEPAPAADVVAEGDDTRSACDLITAKEVNALAHEPVLVTEVVREEGYSECNYTDPSGQWPYLILSVIWEGGREAMEGTLRGVGLGNTLLDRAVAPNAGGDTIVAVGPVAGLGDAAYYRALAPSYVLSGDVMLSLVVAYFPESQRNFRPLVQTILGRL